MPIADKKIVWLILTPLAFRIILSLLFEPLITPDTDSYLQMARRISSNDFSGCAGMRTPVYPLVLLEYSENARYKVPVEPLIVAAAVIFAVGFYRFPARSRESSRSGVAKWIFLSEKCFYLPAGVPENMNVQ